MNAIDSNLIEHDVVRKPVPTFRHHALGSRAVLDEGRTTSSLAELLASGGDARLAVDGATGLNRYGCSVLPRSTTSSFSSSTASSLSGRALIRVDAALASWDRRARARGVWAALDHEVEGLRERFCDLFGLCVSDVDIVFSPSGTDSQIHALGAVKARLGGPLVVIVVGADETGSGTVFTASGRHFAERTAHVDHVAPGAPITGMDCVKDAVLIPARDARGARSLGEIDAAVMEALAAARRAGHQVLLQAMNSSKLGGRYPSDACLDLIRARWPDTVQIVVDACQMRLGRNRLRSHLDRGDMVLVTGSKFFTGPAFSGALLIPATACGARLGAVPPPAGMRAYASRQDWPSRHAATRAALPCRVALGPWLRWEAAMAEMMDYFALPAAFRHEALRMFEVAVAPLIRSGSRHPVTRPQGFTPDEDDEEFSTPTIFPFTLADGTGAIVPLRAAALHASLNRDMTPDLPPSSSSSAQTLAGKIYHIGQPVALGVEGQPTAALRVSADARFVVECWSPDAAEAGRRVEAHLNHLRQAFHKLDLLHSTMDPRLSGRFRLVPEGPPIVIDPQTAVSEPGLGWCDRIGAAPLVRMAYAGHDLTPLRDELRSQSDEPGAAMDLAVIEQVMGNRELGLSIQQEALRRQQCYRAARPGVKPRLRVLALAAPLDLGGNTPIDFLIADPEVELKILYVLPDRPLADRIPDHDVAIVIIPDEDEAAASLAVVNALLPTWPRPILNRPDKIHQLDRDRLFTIIRSIPGLFIPATVKLSRRDLAAVGAGAGLPDPMAFPLIVRPIGSHAGRGLDRLTGPADIDAYLARQADTEFFISPFIDYVSPDGLYRKYRIAFVDGRPFAVHMAMTEQWAVWYLNADMYASADKRDEEARFMERFDEAFGARHRAALGNLVTRLGLDYLIIDCAETKEGDLLVFEAGATMIVHDMDSVDLFPYKAPQMRKIFAAFTAMLDRYAASRTAA